MYDALGWGGGGHRGGRAGVAYCRVVAVSRGSRWRDLPVGLLMVAPSAVILGLFVVYPLVEAIWLGHMRCDALGQNCVSNGWDQYVDVARSNEFVDAFWVTVKFALLTVPTGLVLGIALAVLADKFLRGLAVFRFIFTSTIATSVAVASLMWLFLLQPDIGVLSNIGWLADLFPVIKSPGLLRDPDTALMSVAASSVWASLGFTFVLVTAGLQGIPQDLHEAASVDGAGGIRRFWSITLPMLGPTLLFVVIILSTRAFQAYGEIDLLTRGGPRPENSTTTITYVIYGTDSIITNDIGLQSAVAVLLFGVMLVLSAVQLIGIGRRVHYA
ncbi:MAG TPA: sugar ABC transporter permease [Ilumatobacteraceae bacterium]|nr:sugar ABC transporter permease [Ilumatobacteraceae bacterium]